MSDSGIVEDILAKSIERFSEIDTKNIKVSTLLKDGLLKGQLKNSEWVSKILKDTEEV